jgi:hypothetical protein
MTKIKIRPGQSLEMKGDLYIGDCCYFFTDKRHPGLWGEFCDLMFPGGKDGPATDSGVATITLDNGFEFEFIYTSTAYGDGTYDVSGSGNFKDFGVDAGMYCSVRTSDLRKFDPDFKPAENGVVIESFEGTVSVGGREGWMSGSGTNGFEVDTSGEQEQDEYDEWEDEEEYGDDEE